MTRKVAIVGYGVEGRASYTYWHGCGDEVTVVDEQSEPSEVPANVPTILGTDALSKLADFDLIVRTPPLRPDRIETNGKVWSATNEFFSKCPAQIIGVTGTKGKGTTASLIAKILEAANNKVHLLGNIGVPALEKLSEIQKDDLIVFELSSFQLWDLERSPHIAVVLMIEPDHLDVHSSMEEYVAAKSNIAKHQNTDDVIIYHPSNRNSAKIAHSSPAKKIEYMSPQGAYVADEIIWINQHKVCSVREVGLIGSHNLENITAAITAAWQFTQDMDAIKTAVIAFQGLPHRLEFVREHNGVVYYNDSQATGVGSCLAALRSFDQPTVLILGGSDKGVDMSEVIAELQPGKHFVILIGQSSLKLSQVLEKRKFTDFVLLGTEETIQSIVQVAAQHSVQGGVVLLSPAHASFDMFRSYQDRGDQFKRAVLELT